MDYTYELNKNGKTIKVKGYIGTASKLTLPEVIDGLTVSGFDKKHLKTTRKLSL